MTRRMPKMAANEFAAAQEQTMLLGRKIAEERIASFLLGLVRTREPAMQARRDKECLPYSRTLGVPETQILTY
jgi:CRP/FNR family transcriptional regulator, anaerobic regulatory protein